MPVGYECFNIGGSRLNEQCGDSFPKGRQIMHQSSPDPGKIHLEIIMNEHIPHAGVLRFYVAAPITSRFRMTPSWIRGEPRKAACPLQPCIPRSAPGIL
jgi:hypothetical protein